jgi:membrane protease YdiL (CAAX protease family)
MSVDDAQVRSPAAAPPPPGWYPDPWQHAPWRWWDGVAWTGYAGPHVALAPAAPTRSWFPRRGERDELAGMRGGGFAFAGIVVAFALGLGSAAALRAGGVDEDSVWIIVASQLGLWTGLLGACVLAVRRYGGGSLRRLGLTRLSGRDVWVGVVAGVAARFGVAILIVPFLPLFRDDTVPRNTSYTNGLLHRGGFAVLVTVTIVAVGAPIVEELFFRGLLQSVLTRRFGPSLGIWGQGVLFGFVHFTIGMTTLQAVVTIVSIVAAGVFLGVLRWHFQRLGQGIVAHAVFNLIAVAAIYALT